MPPEAGSPSPNSSPSPSPSPSPTRSSDARFQVDIVANHLAAAKFADADVQIRHYVSAYQELNKFIGMLGTIFQFVQKDVHDKTEILLSLLEVDERAYQSVSSMLNAESSSKKKPGAAAMLALHRALEFILDFMQVLMNAKDEDSVSVMCRDSYNRTLAKFHKWVVRKAVGLASYTLPSRRTLIENIQGPNTSEDTVKTSISRVTQQGGEVYRRVQALYDYHNLNSII